MKSRHLLAIGTSLAVLLYLSSCFWWGVWIFWEPKYDSRNLVGLTPDQVVQRLGPAWYDPRRVGPRGWQSEQRDGPLSLAYRSGVFGVTIDFRDNKVFNVRHFTK